MGTAAGGAGDACQPCPTVSTASSLVAAAAAADASTVSLLLLLPRQSLLLLLLLVLRPARNWSQAWQQHLGDQR
jgi:hypothetical protein